MNKFARTGMAPQERRPTTPGSAGRGSRRAIIATINLLPCFLFPLAWSLSAAAAGAPQPSASALPDCLYFRNGDLLYGSLTAIDPQKSVRWQRPDAPDAIDFKPGSIAQIDFPSRPTPPSQAPGSCKVTFANGDSLEGVLVTIDHDNLILDTPYAHRLPLPRRGLRAVAFTPRDPAIFNGITGLDGWIEGNSSKAFNGEAGQWIYRNGAFYSDKPASIARDLKLPGLAQIEFDLTWKTSLNLAVALYTDSMQPILLTSKDAGPAFGGFYSLRFLSGNMAANVSLMPIRRSDPLRSLGDIMVPALALTNRVHVDVRVNKAAGKVALFFDGSLIKQWTDPNGFIGEGTGLRFVQNPGGALKLSNLRVSKWNGVLGEETGTGPELRLDLVTLETGEKISGTIESLGGEQIAMTTSNGVVKIPEQKTVSVEFAHAHGEASRSGSSVRVFFARGGTISGQLISWSAKAVVLASPDFGQASFDPAVISRLQFVGGEPKS